MTTKRKGNEPIMLRVDAAEVQKLQRGYETRIARQVESITRLQRLLEERTDQNDLMVRANEAAIQEEGARPPGYYPTEPINYVPDDDESAGVRVAGWEAKVATDAVAKATKDLRERVVPADWDWYSESAVNDWDVIVAYVEYLRQDVEHQKGKQHAITQELAQAHADLRVARAEVKNVVALVKTMPATIDADDTPPWEKEGFKPPATRVTATSGVVDSVVERNTPMVAVPDPATSGDAETLSFSGFSAGKLPTDETRPGSF